MTAPWLAAYPRRMRNWGLFAVAVVGLSGWAGSANAQEAANAAAEAAPDEAAPDDAPLVSLTLSPLHLTLPLFEVMGEVRLAPALGASLILGAGQVSIETEQGYTDETEETDLAAYEVGAQATWYPLDDFESLQLGAEALYVHVSGEDIQGDVSGVGQGLAVGPYVGYKLLTGVGFTFFAQLGVQRLTVRAKAENDVGQTADNSSDKWIPLLNLNAGWSF